MILAVFLDRDGVINELVLNPDTGEYEPPHFPEDLIIFPYVIDSLLILQDAGFGLFLVSNQPDYAKGKTTLENLHAVHTRLHHILSMEGIHFQKYYYCYHHPRGVIPEYSFLCECRKPKPFFILQASHDYRIDLRHSWMIGDRDSDIICGKTAGVKTISIEYKHSVQSRGILHPDFSVANLKEAVGIILSNKRNSCEYIESIKPL
jgi:D-glycero-D-manno-heptose 1,7-bisphosphate phosphatase